ncbi:MAG: TRAP transporter large permease [Lachnospiraceae bacterium]|nr:TRAP transporter large permease [Lachnospiraceae bacterium]
MIATVILVMVVLIFLGIPMAVALGVASFTPWLMNSSFAGTPAVVLRSMLTSLDSITLLAIPLFMLSGAIMAKGGISKKLFDVFAIFIGKRTAGIPCAVIITCLFYGAISGSGPATVAAVGVMCLPILIDLGYDKVFSCALVATAGSLGVIIPPSIPMVSYGIMTSTSIGALFTGGIIPGVLIAVALMVYAWFYCKRHGEDKEKVAKNHEELLKVGYWGVLKEGFWALLCPVIILGSIYSGICTPTESACVSVWYALFVSLFIYKTMKPKDIIPYMLEAINSYAGLCMMISVSMAFAKVLTLLKAPTLLATFMSDTFGSKYAFLIVVVIAMLILGMFVDGGPAVTILSPILLPSATALGVDAVHFGIIMVCCLAVGLVTPPFGLNLFVGAPLVDEQPMKIGRAAIPFIGAFMIALLLIVFFPQLTLFLSR